MVVCQTCGHENRSEARFCRFCGQVIEVDAAVQTETAQAVDPAISALEAVGNEPAVAGQPQSENAEPVSDAVNLDESDAMPQAEADITVQPVGEAPPASSTEPQDVDDQAVAEASMADASLDEVLPPAEPPVDETGVELAVGPVPGSGEDDKSPETALVEIISTEDEPGGEHLVEDYLVEDRPPADVHEEEAVEALPEAAEDHTEEQPEESIPEAAEDHTEEQQDEIIPDEAGAEETVEKILDAGTVLVERYEIQKLISQSGGSLLYQAHDRWRCWNCKMVQSDPGAAFCEDCGAELAQPAQVYLRVEPEYKVEATDLESQTWFEEDGVLYHVELPAVVTEESSPVQFQWAIGSLSNTGMQREANEDSLLVLQLNGLCESQSSPALGFFAVADGMGGHDAGEVASRTAIHSLAASIMEQIFTPHVQGEYLEDNEMPVKLQETVLQANQAVLDVRKRSFSNMGSTLTTALVRGRNVWVANVGDSRTYLLRDGKLAQVTRDHSVIARLVEQGLLERDAIYTHEQKGIIYRSMGDRPALEVDIFTLELKAGDRLLLCSDGLWEMVRDPGIEEILLQYYDPQQACEQLIEQANLAGGEDNISAVLVDVRAQI